MPARAASIAAPSGSASATGRSARSAPTTTRIRKTAPETSLASTTQPAATPPFEPEHEELRQTLRRFVAAELRPHAMEWEREKWMPNEVFLRCGELGFLGLKYEERWGGQGG